MGLSSPQATLVFFVSFTQDGAHFEYMYAYVSHCVYSGDPLGGPRRPSGAPLGGSPHLAFGSWCGGRATCWPPNCNPGFQPWFDTKPSSVQVVTPGGSRDNVRDGGWGSLFQLRGGRACFFFFCKCDASPPQGARLLSRGCVPIPAASCGHNG